MPGETLPPLEDIFGDKELAYLFLGESYLFKPKPNNEQVAEFVKEYEEAHATTKSEEALSIDQEAASVSSIMKDTKLTIASDVGEDFESMEVECAITDDDILQLLKRAVIRQYDACLEETRDQNIYLRCAALLKSDYICKDFNNSGGAISWNYPKNILVPVAFKSNSPNSSNEDEKIEGSEMTSFVENFQDYIEFSEKAALARCRSRFPVPVILYKNKFICRSGTLANRKVSLYESLVKSSKPEGRAVEQGVGQTVLTYFFSCASDIVKKVKEATSLIVYGVDEMKEIDAKILKILEVKYICDLMVENRKLHTGMWVSSSEKINLSKYGEFRCLRIPFPGCEFFAEYSKIKSSPDYETERKKLIYNWELPEADSILGLTEEGFAEALPFPELNWKSYTTWDLVTLTKNYMKLLLHFLEKGEGSLLVHCISGWDRTPLFISMLRLSLWADGLIHKELDVNQMAYFTLGYDWYLFGHSLPSRLNKSEEIMHFCFKFLPEIGSADYSLLEDSPEKPKHLQNRSSKIEELSKLVLKHYEEALSVAQPVAENPSAESAANA